MAEEFSPEEKLLRLIRGEKKQKDKPAAEKIEPAKVSPPPPPAEMPPVKLQGAGKPVGGRAQYFKVVNSALVAVLVLIIVFFLFDIVTSKIRPRAEQDAAKGGERAAPPAVEDASHPAAAPFSAYADVGKRELFKPLRSDAQEKAASQRTSVSGQDKLKDLSLIGIVAGDKPQAVIEDRKIQKTYFLNKGQSVNQMIVEDILEDRVILDFEGEKLELVL